MASVHLQIQFQTCLSRRSRGHNHHQLQWKAAIIQVGEELNLIWKRGAYGDGTICRTDDEVTCFGGGA